MRRRTLLVRSAVLAAAGLAGCTGGDGGEPTTEPGGTEPPATPSPTPSATAGRTSTRTPAPTDPSNGGSTESPTETPAPTASADPDQTVIVGPNGDLSFSPRSFEVGVGDTVRWRWDAGGHNVRPSATPDGADWPGTSGGDSRTYGAGYTYTYTFDVAGTYEYYCAPHRAAGMTGSFQVG